MAETITLVEVPWHVPPADELDMPSYRRCDFCYKDATEELLAGLPEAEWRKFHQQKGGVDNGLVVCEKCMGEYLSEKPT
jgi:hypothetical protein